MNAMMTSSHKRGGNMAFFTGNGGSVTVKTVNGVAGVAVLHIANWSIQSDARNDEVSTSAQGYSVFIGTLENNQWSFDLPVDSVNIPESIGFFPGAILDISFKDGANNTYHQLTNTTVGTDNTTNPNTQGAHRKTVNGMGGHLVPYTAGP